MFYVILDAINNVVNDAAIDNGVYKILFFSLLGIIILSAAAFLIYKKRTHLSLFFTHTFSLLKKYTSKSYVYLKGLFTGPIAGFVYSKEQDIYYSSMNAWQRSFGYSRLYDEASAHFAMIMDSEPVYFNYDNKRWLIEFWKGQYGMTTGCEVGVYNTKRPDFYIPGIVDETFYECADNEDMLFISYTLFKNGRVLFSREGKHWWLTGFRLGEFSQPSELTMNISITLKDQAMLDAFIEGINQTGYSDNEIDINGNTVRFVFAKPRSAQPHSRTKEIEVFMQRFNKQNCDLFRSLTQDYTNTSSKLAVLRKHDPALYRSVLSFRGLKKTSYIHELSKKLGGR